MTSYSHVKAYGFRFDCRLTHVGPIYIRFAPIDSVLLAAYFGLEIWMKKLRPEPNRDDVIFPCESLGIWFRLPFDPCWVYLHPVFANRLGSISGILWTPLIEPSRLAHTGCK